jgi:hypothetical protein
MLVTLVSEATASVHASTKVSHNSYHPIASPQPLLNGSTVCAVQRS